MGAEVIAPLMIASTLFSAVGQVQEGRANKRQANYDAAIARNNAIIANRAAADAIAKGKVAERQQRIRTQQEIGRQRASAAARGVKVDVGSAAALNEDTAAIGELDALTIRSNAERQAMGFDIESQNFTSQSELLKSQGKNAATAGKIGAVGTLISGASNVASKWKTF